VDYVFRRLALEYLPGDKRSGLGVQSIEERKEYASSQVQASEAEEAGDADQPRLIQLSDVPVDDKPGARILDAPLCYSCGSKMQPAGSCYVCGSCGSTSGCS
jgi:ribonucleoside-diphosphate reductase alpha chain